jgi:hypothetical protein
MASFTSKVLLQPIFISKHVNQTSVLHSSVVGLFMTFRLEKIQL